MVEIDDTSARQTSARDASDRARTRRPRWPSVVLFALAGCASAILIAFVWNGTRDTWRDAQVGANGHIILNGSYPSGPASRTVRVMALNVAKCWFHRGGLDFASREEVRANLEHIADVIRAERPDVVCLSEVVMEGGPVDLDQVEYLALACGFAHWASAENYSFGLPFFRIRSGNAVLSTREMRTLAVQQLAGEAPFWNPTNNRSVLLFEVRIDGEWVLGASLRNDSFDGANNLRQTDEILARHGDRPALMAGDFNALPSSPSMERWRASGRFVGFADGPPTFPASAPDRRLDQVLAPMTWRVTEQHVVDTGVSDHLAVVATFALP